MQNWGFSLCINTMLFTGERTDASQLPSEHINSYAAERTETTRVDLPPEHIRIVRPHKDIGRQVETSSHFQLPWFTSLFVVVLCSSICYLLFTPSTLHQQYDKGEYICPHHEKVEPLHTYPSHTYEKYDRQYEQPRTLHSNTAYEQYIEPFTRLFRSIFYSRPAEELKIRDVALFTMLRTPQREPMMNATASELARARAADDDARRASYKSRPMMSSQV